MADLAALSSESSFAGAPTDSCSNTVSLSSTPPTSISDSISLASEPQKPEIESVIALLEQPHVASAVGADDHDDHDTSLAGDDVPSQTLRDGDTPTRPRRSRTSAPVYNIAQLSGTAVHGKRRAKGDAVAEGRRRTVLASAAQVEAVFTAPEPANDERRESIVVEDPEKLVKDSVAALDLDWSVDRLDTPKSAPPSQPRRETSKYKPKTKLGRSAAKTSPTITRRTTRLSGPATENLTAQFTTMSKRARKSFEQSHTGMLRELKRLADTKEFAKIEDKPVLHTIWRNGKFFDPIAAAEEEARAKEEAERAKAAEEAAEAQRKLQEEDAARKKARAEAAAAAGEPLAKRQRRPKKWLDKGLYAGQEAPHDPAAGLTAPERKLLSQIPEFSEPVVTNKALPFPMFNGFRLLVRGRDFKLPFDVCHPLMEQPKPKEWRKITKSRFVGDSLSYWKKNTYYDRSVCVCSPEGGCGEDCLNRSVLYECNDENCNVGREYCKNRSFQELQERTKQGGSYRVGVEVFHTGDRGFGVRANRCFEPGQIIMEYAGEIITEEECDRRMNEVYKDKECYYLMSFDQNMILDATTGSIARFVNHSCSPNCRMIKWIVSGTPRMALFAGDRPIMTGDELTYDYNFDPFSAKNVQKCLCGSEKCRGVLGPKTRNDNLAKGNGSTDTAAASKKDAVKAKVKAGKRKLKELFGGPDDAEVENGSAKKRKVQASTGLKRSISSAGLKAAHGAAKTATKIKRSVSSITVTTTKAAVAAMAAHAAASGASTPASGRGSVKKSVARRASTSALLSKVILKKGTPKASTQASTSRSTSTKGSTAANASKTIVAAVETTATPTRAGARGKGKTAAKSQTPASRRKSGKGEIVVERREPAVGSPRTRKPSAKALAAASVEIDVSVLKPTPGSGIKKNRKSPSPRGRKSSASESTARRRMKQALHSAFGRGRKSYATTKSAGSTAKGASSKPSGGDAYSIPATPEPEESGRHSSPAAGRSAIDLTYYAQVRLVPKEDDDE